MIIGGGELESRDIGAKPIKSFFVGVAGCHQHWPHIQIGQMNPARRSAGKFPSHQPKSDHTKADFRAHRFKPGECLKRPWYRLLRERCSSMRASSPPVSRVE